MVPVTLCVGVVIAFQLSAFTCRKNLAATVLLLVLFGYVIGNATVELWLVENKQKSLDLLCTCCWMHDFLSLEVITNQQKIVRKQAETWVWKFHVEVMVVMDLLARSLRAIKEKKRHWKCLKNSLYNNHLLIEIDCMLSSRKEGIITVRSEFQCLDVQSSKKKARSGCLFYRSTNFQ